MTFSSNGGDALTGLPAMTRAGPQQSDYVVTRRSIELDVRAHRHLVASSEWTVRDVIGQQKALSPNMSRAKQASRRQRHGRSAGASGHLFTAWQSRTTMSVHRRHTIPKSMRRSCGQSPPGDISKSAGSPFAAGWTHASARRVPRGPASNAVVLGLRRGHCSKSGSLSCAGSASWPWDVRGPRPRA